MPTTAKQPAVKTKAKTTPDAVQLLTADHKEVRKLFKGYEKFVKAEDVLKEAVVEHASAKDLHQLGDVTASRKEELMSELGAEAAA
ncbi:hypothetical protein [Aquabacterium sp.]|uniref:hypothetical protein n=1 Tax=Aquabacterium sp. TaxID=1872578 RepID=UPI0019BDC331|nr:hypothetical protein [Aquabacterium sp.]MBC7698868.1 hypothetical protein [Aquabacterium sp.]